MKNFIKKILARFGLNLKDKVDFFQLKLNTGTVNKLLYFKSVLDSVDGVEGDIVECGVGKAATAQILVLLINYEKQGRKFWGFDSFEGFPEPTSEDRSFRNPRKGEWKKMTKKDVYDTMLACRLDKSFIDSNVKIIKGFFSETLPDAKVSKIALLHLDVDLYQSYADCLKYLFPRVVEGGVVMFDEYDEPKFPGAKKAIDEYFAGSGYTILKDKIYGKYFLIKK